jgi:hypothetical protein
MQILAKTNRPELAMVTSMLGTITARIFEQGLDAKGSSIGTYTPAYIKQRQKQNYPNSSKVILQATKQMLSDWSVINTGKKLGLGFKNSFNAEKSEWVEATYKTEIFSSTKDESSLAVKLFDEQVTKIING